MGRWQAACSFGATGEVVLRPAAATLGEFSSFESLTRVRGGTVYE